jgi:hypothetical protein
VKWKPGIYQGKGCFVSECGNYRITNEHPQKKKGTNWYVVWRNDGIPARGIKDCFCRMMKMGTLEECKQWEPTSNDYNE